MAKYKLTLTAIYSDNEQAGDAAYYQQYVQAAADGMIDHWNSCEAELQVNDGEVFKAVADGGPTKHPERRTKWPWVLASEMLPTEDGRCLICEAGDWEEAYFYNVVHTSNYVNERPYFHVVDGQMGGRDIFEKDFGHVWWRTVELPEGSGINEPNIYDESELLEKR